MKISRLRLLLFIPFIACTNANNNTQGEPIITTDTTEPITFNTLIKGTGSPTVVFESGLGTPLNNWNGVQSRISDHYKTISYDRKGIGQSPKTDSPRTIENLVKDLRLLIDQNEIEGPIVLVGHSLGGHIVRKYQQEFPSGVVGLFLIDPTHENLYDAVFKQMSQTSVDSMKNAWDKNFKEGPMGVYNEWKEAYNIDQEMRDHPLPSSIPITILASRKESTFLTKQNLQIKDQLFANWKKDKANVKIISTTNSGHYIHLGEPEWVAMELEKFLKSIVQEL